MTAVANHYFEINKNFLGKAPPPAIKNSFFAFYKAVLFANGSFEDASVSLASLLRKSHPHAARYLIDTACADAWKRRDVRWLVCNFSQSRTWTYRVGGVVTVTAFSLPVLANQIRYIYRTPESPGQTAGTDQTLAQMAKIQAEIEGRQAKIEEHLRKAAQALGKVDAVLAKTV